MKGFRAPCCIGLILSVTACASITPKPNLSGQWLLTLASLKSYSVDINQIGSSQVILSGESAKISGQYTLSGNELILKDASQPRLTSLRFKELPNHSWVVTESPPGGLLGLQLSGAIMSSCEKVKC